MSYIRGLTVHCILNISGEVALSGMPQDNIDYKPTLVWLMAWRLQAAKHYVNQFWPNSVMPCGNMRGQWVSHLWSFETTRSDDAKSVVCVNFDKDTGFFCHHIGSMGQECGIITWWWVLYSCRNSLLRQKSPCFDRKSLWIFLLLNIQHCGTKYLGPK